MAANDILIPSDINEYPVSLCQIHRNLSYFDYREILIYCANLEKAIHDKNHLKLRQYFEEIFPQGTFYRIKIERAYGAYSIKAVFNIMLVKILNRLIIDYAYQGSNMMRASSNLLYNKDFLRYKFASIVVQAAGILQQVDMRLYREGQNALAENENYRYQFDGNTHAMIARWFYILTQSNNQNHKFASQLNQVAQSALNMNIISQFNLGLSIQSCFVQGSPLYNNAIINKQVFQYIALHTKLSVKEIKYHLCADRIHHQTEITLKERTKREDIVYNNKKFYQKPLVKIGNDEYCLIFSSGIDKWFSEGIYHRIESYLKENNRDKEREAFISYVGSMTEQYAIELLKSVWNNTFIPAYKYKTGAGNRNDSPDIILEDQNNIYLIEVGSAKLPHYSKHGVAPLTNWNQQLTRAVTCKYIQLNKRMNEMISGCGKSCLDITSIGPNKGKLIWPIITTLDMWTITKDSWQQINSNVPARLDDRIQPLSVFNMEEIEIISGMIEKIPSLSLSKLLQARLDSGTRDKPLSVWLSQNQALYPQWYNTMRATFVENLFSTCTQNFLNQLSQGGAQQ